MSTQLKTIATAVYQGLGAAAGALGQTFSVYRLNSSATGSVISPGCLKYPVFPCYIQRTTSKKLLESATFDLVCYEAKCNGTLLHPGDILIENGYAGEEASQFCVAEVRYRTPFRVVLVKVENNSSIEEPHGLGTDIEAMPSSGASAALFADGAYGGLTPASRHALTLDNGYYGMLAQGQGTLASVPIGIQQLSKLRDAHKPLLPTSYPKTFFTAYIPPTPGYIPGELDVIKAENQDSYQISGIYISTEGFQGAICQLEKLNT